MLSRLEIRYCLRLLGFMLAFLIVSGVSLPLALIGGAPFNREKRSSPLQEEFRRAHAHAVQELSETLRFASSELENCNEWFRFASRMLTWRGEISAGFLEKNWLQSSRAPNWSFEFMLKSLWSETIYQCIYNRSEAWECGTAEGLVDLVVCGFHAAWSAVSISVYKHDYL